MRRCRTSRRRASTASARNWRRAKTERHDRLTKKAARKGRLFYFLAASGLFGRDAHFRRGRFDVRRDVLFELGEVLLEHADEQTGRLVELGLVLPRLDR